MSMQLTMHLIVDNIYDDSKHFQIRCMDYSLSLIVKDELNNNNYHVEYMQKVVRYVSNPR